ncbi:ice-binding family protein [Teredinibacter waterburyi]|uniref:ice-binding family protein n=1 Tax=Teredinibacter waterburyi TaxID=1500538 RepID=UPI00165F5BA3|nr:ice-binding family protein [Teredinibacter waterburyi]
MNTWKKYFSRNLWVSAFLLPMLMTACGGDNDNAPVPTPEPEPVSATVTATTPLNAELELALNSIVTATFSEAMDATTINAQSFTVMGANEAALTGVVTFDTASNIAIFTPGSALTPSTLYTVTLTMEVTNSVGTALAEDYVWSFTSGVAVDVTPPTESSKNPADAVTGFELNGSVSANFSEALDPTTVDESTFMLSESNIQIAGTVSYDNQVATFTPDSNLTASTTYTATLTTGITDLSGNALAANVVWSFTTGSSVAVGPAAVNLRTAGDFVILSKTGITNVPTSAITGDIGASPITGAAMDNVFCTEIVGAIYGSDAGYTGSGVIPCYKGTSPDNTLVANAVLDMGTAYNEAAGRTTPDFTELHEGDISGETLLPGLYKWGTGVLISTDVTLSGGPNDVWIFQIAGDITQADNSSILLAGGALAKNIFWQVSGGTGVAIGTDAHFEGVILAEKGITVNTRSTVNGRLLSQTAVTLDQNAVTEPAQ